MKTILLLLLLFPLAGAVVNALLGRYLPRRAVELIACLGVFGSLTMAAAAFITAGQASCRLTFAGWFNVGGMAASMGVQYDPLAAIMALMVTLVSSLVHLYSVSFMRDEDGVVRYFCYLNLFVFAMLVIILADNLLFVYLGWEGVGFCSYALIGFWFGDAANAAAGRKAFVLTRTGDVAFGIALAWLFLLFGDLGISTINSQAAVLAPGQATLLGLLLLWAAVGKSAQLPLTVWLPDAMAGPTPVSALIHAATMVTAGVYLLMRLFPVVALSPPALLAIAGVGAVTAIYGAGAAMVQWDIKRMLAYSTISQVGYMFLAVGAADIIGGMFHLISHAFFKALLFLAAGCVIQALAEEHNIFRMGNLRRLLPQVFWPFLIGALCLNAFPLIGGFFSKDRILLATFMQPGVAYKVFWGLGAAAAILTPLYTLRVVIMVFQERPDGRRAGEILPLPRLMVRALWPLAVLSLFDGLLNVPAGPGKEFLARYLAVIPGSRPDLGASSAMAWAMGVGSALMVVLTITSAYFIYRRPWPATTLPKLHEFLLSGYYLDRLYQQAIVRPYLAISNFLWGTVDEAGLDRGFRKLWEFLARFYGGLARFFWLKIDERTLDQGLEKAAAGFLLASGGLGSWATGRLSTYLKMLLLGLTGFLGALVLSRFW